MKTLALLVALITAVAVPSAASASTSSVSVTILPGPFTATLAYDAGLVVLTVDDATGSGRGWWVTLDCTCDWVPAGEIKTLVGDAEHGPHWFGATLVAGPEEGSGVYRQAFWATPGSWVMTSAQGGLP